MCDSYSYSGVFELRRDNSRAWTRVCLGQEIYPCRWELVGAGRGKIQHLSHFRRHGNTAAAALRRILAFVFTVWDIV